MTSWTAWLWLSITLLGGCATTIDCRRCVGQQICEAHTQHGEAITNSCVAIPAACRRAPNPCECTRRAAHLMHYRCIQTRDGKPLLFCP